MAPCGPASHHGAMTNSPARARAALLLPLLLALSIAGCSAPAATDADPVDAGSPPAASDGGAASPADDAEPDEPVADDEPEVIGAELASGTAVLLAEVYASGRTPVPSIEFVDAATVRFTFAGSLSESDRIGYCQIAWGSLSGEGVDAVVIDDETENDCTALIDG